MLAPYLFLPLLLLVPLSLRRGAASLRLVLIAFMLLFVARFPPHLRSAAPARASGQSVVTVLNWNVEASPLADQRARVRPVLAAAPAEIVVLEEAYWRWLGQDDELVRRYPFQLVDTQGAESGLVLLSQYPFREHGSAAASAAGPGRARLLWARLDLGGGKSLLLVAAHPQAPSPVRYDTSDRDALLAQARALLDTGLRRGDPVMLVGDLNLTTREPTYHELATGLIDTHRHVGGGPGNTWQPGLFGALSIPLLRIDYILVSPAVAPLRTTVDCTARGSDHCIIYATLPRP